MSGNIWNVGGRLKKCQDSMKFVWVLLPLLYM